MNWPAPRKHPRFEVESVRVRRRTEAEQVREQQIIAILHEQEVGAATSEVCRRHGISDATFYKWKAKYRGMEVSDTKRLRGLEDENRRLKKLLAEAILDNAALKDLLGKNG
jgi:putative transposase